MSVTSPVDGVEPVGVSTPSGTVVAWDLPTRLFKWALVLLVVDAYLSNRYGAGYPLWHKLNGYAILVLVSFRILWGLVGPSTARFSNFVKPFRAVPYALQMFRRPGHRYLGHNPVGGVSVLLLLGVLSAQAILGLFSSDDDRLIIEGPFAHLVSDGTVTWATHWHRSVFNIILALVAVHLAAVVFYVFVKKQPILRAMITGAKPAGSYEDEQAMTAAHPAAAIACLVFASALVFGVLSLSGVNIFR